MSHGKIRFFPWRKDSGLDNRMDLLPTWSFLWNRHWNGTCQLSKYSFIFVYTCIFIGLNTVSATHWTIRGWIHKEDWGCGKSGAQTEHHGEHWMSLHACWHAKYPANRVNFKPLNDVILSNIGYDTSFRYCFKKHCNAWGRWFGTQPNPIHYSLFCLKYTRIEIWHMQLSPFLLALGNFLLTVFFHGIVFFFKRTHISISKYQKHEDNLDLPTWNRGQIDGGK